MSKVSQQHADRVTGAGVRDCVRVYVDVCVEDCEQEHTSRVTSLDA